jgi:diacylglycerol O-acyltransferase
MRQLTGLDAAFVYMEDSHQPQHIGSMGIYDPSTAPNGMASPETIAQSIKDRAYLAPLMRQKLQQVPFNLDHPYWLRVDDFELEDHVHHLTLPAPGNWQQLCTLLSQLHEGPLDRSRPLWEMYVIEGLDKVKGYPRGCFAVFTKIHHAAVDGASGNEISALLHDTTPDWQDVAAEGKDLPMDKPASDIRLLLRAQLNTLRQPFRFVDVARHSVPGIARFAAGVSSGRLHRVTTLPRTRFNLNVSPHRVFGAEMFDFADIRAIKNAVPPATVNDVALSICGGALRKYLRAKDELPEQSLAAMAPINVRTEDKKGTFGNLVSQMTVKVCSDIEDPIQRLQAVNEGTRDAKELTNAIGAKTMTDYTQFIPSTLTASAARLASSLGLANRIKPIYNCVITNVPGPQEPLYFNGAKMLSTVGTGPIMDGTGLFHAISSYCGQFGISFVSCRAMMPDSEFYSQCLHESFSELQLAADKLQTKPKAKANRGKAQVKAKRSKRAANPA